MSLMICNIDKGEFVCPCWWPELYLRVFHCTSLDSFVCLFVCLFLQFMVYSVETHCN